MSISIAEIRDVVLNSKSLSIKSTVSLCSNTCWKTFICLSFVFHWTVADVEVALRKTVAIFLGLRVVERLELFGLRERVVIARSKITHDSDCVLRA